MTTVSFSNRGVDYSVNFQIVSPNFNGGAGLIYLNSSRTRNSIGIGQPWQYWLSFSSRATSSRQSPAWEFSAEGLTVNWNSLNVSSPTAWEVAGQEIGFIQNLEHLEYSAQYQGIPQRFIMLVNDAADVNPHPTGEVSPPWYNTSGRDGGPQPLVTDTNTPMAFPTINDSPEVTFRVLGHLSRPINPLRIVRANGSFLIWLVVKHQDDPVQVSALRFLYYLRIAFSRSWIYNNTGDPDRPTEFDFRSMGQQSVTNQGQGQGPSFTPVFSDKAAYEHLRKESDRLPYPFR
jgi:hypothetical protein